jgi:hypothetical protein
MTQAPPKDPTETKMQSSQSNDLSTYIPQSLPKEPTETKMQSKYQELYELELGAEQVVPPEKVPAKTDPIIDEVLEDIEPENQLVVYGPQRVGESSTATEQAISNKKFN